MATGLQLFLRAAEKEVEPHMALVREVNKQIRYAGSDQPSKDYVTEASAAKWFCIGPGPYAIINHIDSVFKNNPWLTEKPSVLRTINETSQHSPLIKNRFGHHLEK